MIPPTPVAAPGTARWRWVVVMALDLERNRPRHRYRLRRRSLRRLLRDVWPGRGKFLQLFFLNSYMSNVRSTSLRRFPAR